MIHSRKKLSFLAATASIIVVCALALAVIARPKSQAGGDTNIQPTFSTPDEAVQALVAAAKEKDRQKIGQILGPFSKVIVSGDDVSDANDLEDFILAATTHTELDKKSDTKIVLHIGNDKWPFSIPIALKDGRWFFDTQAGLGDLLKRRIGANEEGAVKVCKAYVLAQADYLQGGYSSEGGVASYAQRLLSSPGKKDGLYWPTAEGEKPSPLGQLVALGRTEGYSTKEGGRADASATPYHGYLFRILKGQGPYAPGGRRSFLVNGKMTGGFALVAYPAIWGKSGAMTFIVNQDGRVYQKNYGETTAQTIPFAEEFNPDPTWQPAKDPG